MKRGEHPLALSHSLPSQEYYARVGAPGNESEQLSDYYRKYYESYYSGASPTNFGDPTTTTTRRPPPTTTTTLAPAPLTTTVSSFGVPQQYPQQGGQQPNGQFGGRPAFPQTGQNFPQQPGSVYGGRAPQGVYVNQGYSGGYGGGVPQGGAPQGAAPAGGAGGFMVRGIL